VGPSPTAVAMVTCPGGVGNMCIHPGSAMCSELAWWKVRGASGRTAVPPPRKRIRRSDRCEPPSHELTAVQMNFIKL